MQFQSTPSYSEQSPVALRLHPRRRDQRSKSAALLVLFVTIMSMGACAGGWESKESVCHSDKGEWCNDRCMTPCECERVRGVSPRSASCDDPYGYSKPIIPDPTRREAATQDTPTPASDAAAE